MAQLIYGYGVKVLLFQHSMKLSDDANDTNAA
jgi:hypothetical protein